MATFARPRFCAKGHSLMSKKRRQVTMSVTTGVKLRRISCDQARPYPPDGQARDLEAGTNPGANTGKLIRPSTSCHHGPGTSLGLASLPAAQRPSG